MDHKREYWRYCKGSSRWGLASEACEMPKDMVADLVSGLFGLPAKMAVERGLAEFRAGRPVLFAAESSVIAVPVDALDAERLHSFVGAFASSADALPLPRAVTAVPVGPAAIAAIELAKLAQRLPALLIAAADPNHELPDAGLLLSVEAEALGRFRQRLVESLRIAATSRVPLEGAEQAQFVVFRDGIGGSPAAIVIGEPDLAQPVLVRLHSACLTGDVFGSRRCDCGDQLKLAIARVKHAGGIILYLDQEGRGLGLANKMQAYRLQDCGLDTVDANVTLGFENDERDYGIAARMLQLLGCRRVVLLTNNPAKLDGLAGAGIEVCGCMPLHAPVNAENRRYLTAKAVRAGHRLDHLWRS